MIRLASREDAPSIRSIFAPIVENTSITFAVTPPSVEEVESRISDLSRELPWLVFEEDGRILGYAYAGKHRVLAAYQWNVETSIYVADQAHGRGVARSLYRKLIELLRAQGYFNAYAGITLPNEKSVRFHEAVGFKKFATYDSVGFKQGKWHDVGWWKLAIQSRYDAAPRVPITLPELLDKHPELLATC